LWREIDWKIPALIAIAAIIVSTIASHHASKLPVVILRKGFAILLFFIATFSLIETWFISQR